jgi:hypothetical protein
MSDSFYKLHTPIPAVALGFLTTTLFEFIPGDAVVRVRMEYQETGLVELQWEDSCYITYLETLKSNAAVVAAPSDAVATDPVRDPARSVATPVERPVEGPFLTPAPLISPLRLALAT